MAPCGRGLGLRPQLLCSFIVLLLLLGTATAGFVHNCGNAHVANQTDKYLQYFATSQSLKAAALRASSNNVSAVGIKRQPVAVSSPAPIRIFVEYQLGSSSLSASQKTQVQSLMASAVNILQRFLHSKYPVDGNLLVEAYCVRYNVAGSCTRFYPEFRAVNNADKSCGVANINPNHIAANAAYGGGSGEATDYYLYVTAADSSCSGVVAWATYCLQDSATHQPRIGTANFCPGAAYLLSTEPESAIAVLMHEMIHALGFHSGLYRYYLRPGTTTAYGPSSGTPNSVQAMSNAYSQSTYRVITPNVVSFVRSQFGCDNAAGGELEDGGGGGSAGSHWEYTKFQGELMVSTIAFSTYNKPVQLSGATLALLEDTGWYVPQYSAAGYLEWGKGQDCGFLDDRCSTFDAANPTSLEYCTTGRIYSCAADHIHIGSCSANSGFGNSCNMVNADDSGYSGFSCADPAWDAYKWGVNGLQTDFGFQSSYTARCAELSASVAAGSSTYTAQAACFPMACVNGDLKITVKGSTITCAPGNTTKSLAGIAGYTSGTLTCPDVASMCSTLDCATTCQPHGECHEGRCYCNLAYTGADCAGSLWDTSGSESGTVVVSMTVAGPASAAEFAQSTVFIDGVVFLCNKTATVAASSVSLVSASVISSLAAASSSGAVAAAGSAGTAAAAAAADPPASRRRLLTGDLFSVDGGSSSGAGGAVASSRPFPGGRRLLAGVTLQAVFNVAAGANADAVFASASNPDRQAQFIAAMKQRLGWTVSNIMVSRLSSAATGLPASIIYAIVGAVVGGVFLIAAIVTGVCMRRRRMRRRMQAPVMGSPAGPLVTGYPAIGVPEGFVNPLHSERLQYPPQAGAPYVAIEALAAAPKVFDGEDNGGTEPSAPEKDAEVGEASGEPASAPPMVIGTLSYRT